MGRPFLSNEFMSPIVHNPYTNIDLQPPSVSYLDAPIKWSPTNAFDPDDLPIIEDEFIPFPTPSPASSPSPSPSPPPQDDRLTPSPDHLQILGANGETITVPVAYHFDSHSQTVVVTLTRGAPPLVTIVTPSLRDTDTFTPTTGAGAQEVLTAREERRLPTSTEELARLVDEASDTVHTELSPEAEDDAGSEFGLDPDDYLSDEDAMSPYAISPSPTLIQSPRATLPHALATTFVPDPRATNHHLQVSSLLRAY